jgi:hypothetical protein
VELTREVARRFKRFITAAQQPSGGKAPRIPPSSESGDGMPSESAERR